jgi:hypothetical protein
MWKKQKHQQKKIAMQVLGDLCADISPSSIKMVGGTGLEPVTPAL